MNTQNSTLAAETSSEVIGLLTAISVVSKRLAGNLRKLEEQADSKEANGDARNN